MPKRQQSVLTENVIGVKAEDAIGVKVEVHNMDGREGASYSRPVEMERFVVCLCTLIKYCFCPGRVCLNDDVLLHVFSYLSLKERVLAERGLLDIQHFVVCVIFGGSSV